MLLSGSTTSVHTVVQYFTQKSTVRLQVRCKDAQDLSKSTINSFTSGTLSITL